MSLLDKVKEDKIVDLNKEEEVKEVEVEEKEFNQFDEIVVYSYVDGVLHLKSDEVGVTETHDFDGFLDKKYVTYGLLKSIRDKNPTVISRPLIYIDDDDVIEKLRLTRICDGLFKPKDFEEFFNKSKGEIIEILDEADRSLRKLLRDASLAMIKNEKLTDYNKIKILSEKLGFVLEKDTRI